MCAVKVQSTLEQKIDMHISSQCLAGDNRENNSSLRFKVTSSYINNRRLFT